MIVRDRVLIAGKTIVVVGMGLTGLYTARFLAACGADVVATDIKPKEELKGLEGLEDAGVEIAAGGYRQELFKGADMVVVSPGVRTDTAMFKAIADTTELISDVELLARLTDVPIVAVTGTNGKSTTTRLIEHMLKQRGTNVFTGGNIGVPALKFFEQEYELCLLEISSFQLENIASFRPTVAVLLNISEDHMDRYDSFDHYVDTKFRIFMNQKEEDHRIVNLGDSVIKEEVEKRGLFDDELLAFSLYDRLEEGIYIDGDHICCRYLGTESQYPLEGLRLKGAHNIENTMAAIGVGAVIGVDQQTIKKSIYGFNGLAHRMEFVRELDGVSYINDSKATNPAALRRALESFPEGAKSLILIAGGKDKGMDFSVLKDAIEGRVKLLVLIGEAKDKFNALDLSVSSVEAEGLAEAVDIAKRAATRGDTVLLSPGCASFDMFEDFEHRGNSFKELVRRL